MKHLGMVQPWGYWRSKQFSLILPLTLQLQLGLITCRNWIGNPITPMHPTLLVAEEAEKTTRALVDYASGEAEGTVCDSFEQREFSVGSGAV